MLERAPTLQMEVAKLRHILWLGLCNTRRLRLHLRSAPEPSSQACPDLPRRRSRSTRCGALRHSRRCSMHSLKTFSEIAAVMLVSVTVFGTGCERPAPLSPPAAERSSNTAPAAEATYSVIGDCARATVIDPGNVKNVAGMLIQRGTVFDCPLTGDIEGVARVVLNLTLRNAGTPQVQGRVFGQTIFLVTKFFGRTDLSGTFEGPFNGSLEATQPRPTGEAQAIFMVSYYTGSPCRILPGLEPKLRMGGWSDATNRRP